MGSTNQILTTNSLELTQKELQKNKIITTNYINAKPCINNSAMQLRINFNHALVISQVYGLLIAFFFIINMTLIPWGAVHSATPPVTGPVKWHPGHYYTIMGFGKDKTWYMDQVYRELKSTPALRGLQVRYLWAEIEKSEGVYDFASIDRQLAALTTRGKRLVIQVQTKSFDPEWKLVPDYLKTAKYEGGVFAFGTYGTTTIRGHNIKLWNPMVRDRLIALFRALGKRYNSHPNFEGIGMIETALGQSMDPLSSAQISGFYANLLSVHQQMRLHFPNTMTIQEVNYPRDILESFVGALKNMGTGLSGPDIFLEEPGLLYEGTQYASKGIYHHYPEVAGIIPVAPQVMASNYENTRHDGTGYQPTMLELLAFARDRLKSNYIFWARSPEYYPKVLEMLNWSEQKKDPAGGLSIACPSNFSSCAN